MLNQLIVSIGSARTSHHVLTGSLEGPILDQTAASAGRGSRGHAAAAAATVPVVVAGPRAESKHIRLAFEVRSG